MNTVRLTVLHGAQAGIAQRMWPSDVAEMAGEIALVLAPEELVPFLGFNNTARGASADAIGCADSSSSCVDGAIACRSMHPADCCVNGPAVSRLRLLH